MESLHVASSSGTHVPVQAAASGSYMLEIAFTTNLHFAFKFSTLVYSRCQV